MTEIELGTLAVGSPGQGVRAATAAEDDGYDIALFTDSQNLRGDPYGQLTLAAISTSRIRIGTGVTNPVTRHPAVTAAAILSVHAESGGRAILGIGRGDSSLGHIGRRPASMKVYGDYVRQVQTYLSGGEVDQHGFPSRLRWMDGLDLPKVPLDMSCSGPQSIALAASLAERVTFAVGAAPERIEWALGIAREAAGRAGRDPDSVRFGAWINAVAIADREAAREALRGGVASFAHFSGMHDSAVEDQPEIMRRVSTKLQTQYDTRAHGQADADHASVIDDEFIDWFAVAGPPDVIVERLRPLLDLGLSHLYFTGASRAGSRELFAGEVLPALRG